MLVTQSCPALCNPMNCNPSGSFDLGILQARKLEWVATAFSRVSSWPRDETWVSCTAGRLFTTWATREALLFKELLLTFLGRQVYWQQITSVFVCLRKYFSFTKLVGFFFPLFSSLSSCYYGSWEEVICNSYLCFPWLLLGFLIPNLCLCIVLFCGFCIYSGVLWASWICDLVSDINLEKFCHYYFKYFFYSFFSPGILIKC